MALLGRSKLKFDSANLQRLLDQGAKNERTIINTAFGQTPQVSQQFEQRRAALGQTFETGANQRAQQFAQQLQNVESPDFVRDQQAKARELAFRDLPTAQQNIREQLGATGGLNRGVAIRALAQPTLQAAQAARDESFQIQQEARGRDIQRRQAGLDTIFRTGQGAALEKLGIDKQTANVLLETGRSDILDRAFKLAGIESGRTQGLIDIEQNRLTFEREQAASRGGALGTIGTIGGAVVGGAFGGIPGAAIGSNIGGSLGSSLQSQGRQQLDLSALLAIRRRQRSQPQQNPGPQG